MLTPIDIQNRTLKAGMGYKKAEVDTLIAELFRDYEGLYKRNAELENRVKILTEGVQYYKNIEKTIQSALILAEQTAEESKEAASQKAGAMIDQARNQANTILAEAKGDLAAIQKKSQAILQEYERYRLNFKHFMEAQLELLDGEGFQAHLHNSRLDDLLDSVPVSPGADSTVPTDLSKAIQDTQEIKLESIAAILSQAEEEGRTQGTEENQSQN